MSDTGSGEAPVDGRGHDMSNSGWGSDQWCDEVARQWADGLCRSADIPMARSDLESRLRELVDRIVRALREPDRIDETGQSIGDHLVRLNAIGENSLSHTLELLRRSLVPEPGNEAFERVLSLLAAVAAGYAGADRASTLDQQETMKRALLRSKLNTERELRVSESRFREMFRTTPVGVAICELDGRFLEVNPALEETLGYAGEELREKTIFELFNPDELATVSDSYSELAQGIRTRLRERRNLVRSDGQMAWTYVAVSLLRDADGAPHRFVTMIEDLRELSHLQERLSQQSLHDAITGLPNRQHFRTRLETALGSQPAETKLTLYHLRLDAFQLINDGIGYEVGDSIVKSVAHRLQGLIEDEDGLVARIGGTEFAILIKQTPNTPDVATFASMINEELDEPIYVGDYGIAPTANIGVIQRAVGDREPTDMMWAAGVALRSAEEAGKRQWALFDPELAPIERADAKLAVVMPGALELGEFDVNYRPLISLEDGKPFGVEARLSWQLDEGEPISHDECLRLAERSGVALSLRDWVIRTAWRQLAEWEAEGLSPQLVVGLSPNQSKDPDLVAKVREIVGDAATDGAAAPSKLRLCMSMPALMGRNGEARDNVGTLAAMGVETAAHDFRASPSELRFLRDCPTYGVMLAPELFGMIEECSDPNDPEVLALTSMIPLVRDRGVPVAVAGISTAEQHEWWAAAGCGIATGSYYGGTVAAEKMTELLRAASDGHP